MKAFKLFLLSLIPSLALAQPYGGEMCRVYDGTDQADVASDLLSYLTHVPVTTNALHTIAHFSFIWSPDHPDTPGADGEAYGGLMNDRGEFLVAPAGIRNSPIAVGHGTATTYTAGSTAMEGSQRVVHGGVSTMTQTSVTAATSATLLKNIGTRRGSFYLFNDSPFPAYIGASGVSTSTAYRMLQPYETWIVQQPIPTTAIYAIWSTGGATISGSMRVTEGT